MRKLLLNGAGLVALMGAGSLVLLGGVPDLSNFSAEAQLPTEVEQNFQSALSEAQKQANSGNVAEAIELTASIPSNSQHSPEAKQLTEEWAKSLLQEATLAHKSADLDTALAKLSAIPASASVHSQAQELQGIWSQHGEVLKQIADSAKKEDWASVLAVAGQLDEDLSQSPKVQEFLTAALSGLPQEEAVATQVASSKTIPTPEVPQIPTTPSIESAPVALAPVGADTQRALEITAPEVVQASLPALSLPAPIESSSSAVGSIVQPPAKSDYSLASWREDGDRAIASSNLVLPRDQAVVAQQFTSGSAGTTLSIPETVEAVTPEAIQELSKPDKPLVEDWQGRVDKATKPDQSATEPTSTAVGDNSQAPVEVNSIHAEKPGKTVPEPAVASQNSVTVETQVPSFEEFAASEAPTPIPQAVEAPSLEVPLVKVQSSQPVPSFEEFAQAAPEPQSIEVTPAPALEVAAVPEPSPQMSTDPVPVAVAPTLDLASCFN